MNLASDLLAVGAPESVAVIAGRTAITYRELRDKVDEFALALLTRGSRRQERVAIWAENGVFFVVSYLAVIRAGLVAVPISMDAAPEIVRRILEDAGVRMVLASDRCQTDARRAAGTDVTVLSESDAAEPRPSFDRPLDVDSVDDLAALMFTSGSTGKPKGVMVTQRNIACNTRDIVDYLELTSRDRCLVVLPFSYCFGLSLLHTHLAVGGSVVINNQFRYPETVLRELADRACTGLAGVPSTYQMLMRNSRFTQLTFPSLRWLQQAGGWLPNALIQEITNAFPSVRFHVMYGQTEATARLSHLPPERLQDKLGSIGNGLASTVLEVLRPDGSPVRPGSGEVGEIVAAGENVTRGYWNDPHETAKYFRAGRLHTGDLARVDADGFIYVVDRERDIIKVGGTRVSAREIEEVVAEAPTVVASAVVGSPHDILGEAIVVFVATEPSCQNARVSVLDHCRRRLPQSKVPEAVVHLTELPLGDTGKILKGKLRQIAAQVLGSCSPDSHDAQVLAIERKSDRRAHGEIRLASNDAL